MEMQHLDRARFFPQVLQAVPTDAFEVYAYMNDGSVRLFDVKPFLKADTVFAPLMDLDVFQSKLTVIHDTVAWDLGGNRNPARCVDLDPFALFAQPAVADPLGGERHV